MQPISPNILPMAMVVLDLDATVVVQLIIILTLVFVLRGWVFLPLLEATSKRRARTDEARHEAKVLAAKADQLSQRLEADLNAARLRAAQAKAELRSEGMRAREAVAAAARKSMLQKLEEARANITRSTEQARGAMAPHVEDLSRLLATKLLGRNP